ncbi:MAG: hypothetical protein IPG57_06450 [Burkholderiales bacterium]|nr:hypothetical protein [Burkholderiales bacterium]
MEIFQALSGNPLCTPTTMVSMLQLGLASNWGWEVGPSFNGPIWSISLEVVVYGLFFGVMRLVGSGRWVAPGMLLLGALGYLLKIPSQIFPINRVLLPPNGFVPLKQRLVAQTEIGTGYFQDLFFIRAVGLPGTDGELQTVSALVCVWGIQPR